MTTRNGIRPQALRLEAPPVPGQEAALTAGALEFLAELVERFGPAIRAALADRVARRARWAAGEALDFLPETLHVRAADWTGPSIPADLERRTVEITGPPERKMIINALNSGADVFMADFEDSNAPTWANLMDGQRYLQEAVRRTLSFQDPETSKSYRLNERLATLMVRPRGLHLPEAHLTRDGAPVPASLVDFGLFFLHNAAELLRRGSGPYFYLPKLESHLEARIWNDVFEFSEQRIGVPRGSIRATCLIETLPAAFEMDEILHELRAYTAGLNCGRWDYIFSFIKARRAEAAAVLPDRSQVTMEQPCMRAYTQLTVRICHRRGVHAIGGMAAQIPIRTDAEASARALDHVRADKLREVRDGHDGTWVAHPGLVQVARDVFEAHMTGPNQIARRRDDVRAAAAELLEVPQGTRTEDGLRLNLRVGVQYLEAWLRGLGCVPLYHLMEDAATAEISRTQIWHWLRHGAALEDGRVISRPLVERMLDEELQRIADEIGAERFAAGRFGEAVELFLRVSTGPELEEFLTLPAYESLCAVHDLPHDERTHPPVPRR